MRAFTKMLQLHREMRKKAARFAIRDGSYGDSFVRVWGYDNSFVLRGEFGEEVAAEVGAKFVIVRSGNVENAVHGVGDFVDERRECDWLGGIYDYAWSNMRRKRQIAVARLAVLVRFFFLAAQPI